MTGEIWWVLAWLAVAVASAGAIAAIAAFGLAVYVTFLVAFRLRRIGRLVRGGK